MVIHFLKEDSLTALKTTVKDHIRFYESPKNEWIYIYFDKENPFAEYKIQIEDFQFITAEINTGKSDVENAIRLYSSMKMLSDTQATDERLWAGLCHGDFWEYMYCRWKSDVKSRDLVSTITSRYFLNNKDGARRSLFINTLSRLWWLGRVTYDENRKDPFELTRYWESDFSTKLMILFSSNYMGNPVLAHGLISALISLEKDGFSLKSKKRDTYYLASQYLNVFGGTHILDYYTEEEIKDKVLLHMWGLIDKKPPVS